MRIILDHNTPAPLRYFLKGYETSTAYERGWAELTNGKLLAAAEEGGFDLMITTDQNIRYQQNLTGRKLTVILIDTNDWPLIRKNTDLVLNALSSILPGQYVEVNIPLARDRT